MVRRLFLERRILLDCRVKDIANSGVFGGVELHLVLDLLQLLLK